MVNALPEFEHPPLDEVVIGVQFAPLENFHAAHLGLYWSRIRTRYPHTEEQPAMPPQTELADVQPAKGAVFQMPFIPRCWFIDQTKSQLIQLQSDRFWRNWRQFTGTEPYPRFPHLIGEFRKDWDGFLAFVEQESLGKVQVNQCELSYINNIERGAGWHGFADLSRVFSLIRPSAPSGFLPEPELLTWQANYKLPDGRGRLHVDMNPAFRGRDFKFILSLNLTARGAPSGGSTAEILAWFNLAHEWIVRGFDELTERPMHELWKKKQ